MGIASTFGHDVDPFKNKIIKHLLLNILACERGVTKVGKPKVVTFLALDFWCTPTPTVHQIIMGYPYELDIFNQPYGNLRACP